MSALDTLKTFDLTNTPDLDVAVEGALELLSSAKLPEVNVPFQKPLVIGSVNAGTTGRIMFQDRPAVFASESDFEVALEREEGIDGAVVISASGSKHSIQVAERLKELELPGVLFTNNPDAPAASFFDPGQVFVFPKNREPYTYNTSTYFSMILSVTKEKPADILAHVQKLKTIVSLGDFTGFTFVLPVEHMGVAPMLRVKFEELFGTKLCGRFFSPEEIKHAKTVVPDEHELFVYVGMEELDWGEEGKKTELPLPDNSGALGTLATCYHFIGQIQKAHPPYFKDNLARYCIEAGSHFGQEINPIVE